jgi:hypothetical protein
LNTASIDQAIQELEDYRKKVKGLGPAVVKRLVEDGTEEAKNMALYMNAYDSGELVNGIQGEYDGKEGAIHSTAAHSAYVEYGTGIRGSQDPHPESVAAGWKYDVNEHGEKGWFYLGKDGKRHWTKGMPHRPFMYDTAQVLRQSVEYIAKSEMKKE